MMALASGPAAQRAAGTAVGVVEPGRADVVATGERLDGAGVGAIVDMGRERVAEGT